MNALHDSSTRADRHGRPLSNTFTRCPSESWAHHHGQQGETPMSDAFIFLAFMVVFAVALLGFLVTFMRR